MTLSVSHLTRRFGARTAVDDVSIDLVPGEIFALLGPNGAGKTTTLRMLAGLIAPTAGEIRIDGEVLPRQHLARLRARVGFLTEAPGLWDRLTVEENLLVHAKLHGLPQPRLAVDRALDRFDITERRHERAAHLSKGLKQRVALARTLLHDPDVVLLDEPTSGLDPASARTVRDVMLRLRDERRVVLLSTHNLDEARRVSSRVAVLRTRLLALDTPEALHARLFGSRLVVTVVREGGRLAAALLASGREVTQDGERLTIRTDDPRHDAPDVVRALVAAGADIVSVTCDETPLEDVYLTLVEQGEAAS
jgi:ABC-2 type transport system ATP-binding protein